jgi:glycosyltransferase involved in cell wall biosynthesis
MTCQGQTMTEKCVAGLASVIVPTFNRARLLGETLDSIYQQTYRPIELVIVDDGSTDDTRPVVETWGHRHLPDHRFRLRYFFQAHAGAPAARNKGLVECQGEYIQFFDSDDLMHPDKIRLQAEALGQKAWEWSGCLLKRFAGTVTHVVAQTTPRQCHHLTPDRNAVSGVLCTQVGLYRRGLLRRVGFWREDLRIMQDTEYMFRILLAATQGAWVERPLCLLRDTPDSITNQPIGPRSAHTYQSIRILEELARHSGWDTGCLRRGFGRMMAFYSRQLLVGGLMEESENLYREALLRLGWRRRWEQRMYRVFLYHGGLSLLKKRGWY